MNSVRADEKVPTPYDAKYDWFESSVPRKLHMINGLVQMGVWAAILGNAVIFNKDLPSLAGSDIAGSRWNDPNANPPTFCSLLNRQMFGRGTALDRVSIHLIIAAVFFLAKDVFVGMSLFYEKKKAAGNRKSAPNGDELNALNILGVIIAFYASYCAGVILGVVGSNLGHFTNNDIDFDTWQNALNVPAIVTAASGARTFDAINKVFKVHGECQYNQDRGYVIAILTFVVVIWYYLVPFLIATISSWRRNSPSNGRAGMQANYKRWFSEIPRYGLASFGHVGVHFVYLAAVCVTLALVANRGYHYKYFNSVQIFSGNKFSTTAADVTNSATNANAMNKLYFALSADYRVGGLFWNASVTLWVFMTALLAFWAASFLHINITSGNVRSNVEGKTKVGNTFTNDRRQANWFYFGAWRSSPGLLTFGIVFVATICVSIFFASLALAGAISLPAQVPQIEQQSAATFAVIQGWTGADGNNLFSADKNFPKFRMDFIFISEFAVAIAGVVGVLVSHYAPVVGDAIAPKYPNSWIGTEQNQKVAAAAPTDSATPHADSSAVHRASVQTVQRQFVQSNGSAAPANTNVLSDEMSW